MDQKKDNTLKNERKYCKPFIFCELSTFTGTKHFRTIILINNIIISNALQVVIYTLKLIDLFHISDLILKINVFIIFYVNYFPYDGQDGIRSSKSNEKDNGFEYHFLIICTYLNLVKKSEDNFIANAKLQVVTILFFSRLCKNL
jgi:hypothetical protein